MESEFRKAKAVKSEKQCTVHSEFAGISLPDGVAQLSESIASRLT